MKRFGLLLLVMAVVLALLPAGLAYAKPAPMMRFATTHAFDGTLGTGAYDGYLRAWVGEIDLDGDGIYDGVDDGDIVWWLYLPSMVCAGPDSMASPCPTTGHYSMIVEIWDVYPTGTRLLATSEHGATTWPNFTWRANGVVTHASGVFAGWNGRMVHESGNFWFSASFPIPPFEGESVFQLN